MSKRLEFLKKAIFYAQQNPDILAEFLHGYIAEVPASIVLAGPTSLDNDNVDGSVHAGYTAVAYNEYGDVLSTAVTIALKEAVSGVSYSSGSVTLTSAVADGTTFILKSTISGSAVTAELPVAVVVRAIDSIVVSGDEILVNDAVNGLVSDPYTAVAYDEDDEVVVAAFTFALNEAVSGVSINSSTGVVTLTSTVADGTTFVVKVTAANSTVIGLLTVTVSVPQE